MSTTYHLKAEQTVAVAIAHDHIDTQVQLTGELPDLQSTLEAVANQYGNEAEPLEQSNWSSQVSKELVNGLFGLAVFLALRKRRTKRRSLLKSAQA